jgi:hypothetical protein
MELHMEAILHVLIEPQQSKQVGNNHKEKERKTTSQNSPF